MGTGGACGGKGSGARTINGLICRSGSNLVLINLVVVGPAESNGLSSYNSEGDIGDVTLTR